MGVLYQLYYVSSGALLYTLTHLNGSGYGVCATGYGHYRPNTQLVDDNIALGLVGERTLSHYNYSHTVVCA